MPVVFGRLRFWWRLAGQHCWALILGEVLQQIVRLLVVRRCDRCWDVVPRACFGEHLAIRTLAVSSALLVLSERAGGRLRGCCSSVTTGPRIITMWRS